MPAIGKIRVRKTKTHLIVSDESGQSYTLPRSTGRPLLLDIDPRIDLTRPIYDQVQKIAARDKSTTTSAKRRKRHVKAA